MVPRPLGSDGYGASARGSTCAANGLDARSNFWLGIWFQAVEQGSGCIDLPNRMPAEALDLILRAGTS